MEKVSLYIPCYNAESSISKCLDSVINQSYGIDEILVINDGSTDKSLAIISKYPVRVITHKGNKGLAACRNTAFREARNEFVASLDADCVADHEWLTKLMGCFSDKNIVGVGGMLIERYILSLADRWRSVHMAQNWGDKFVDCPEFLYGSNAVFKKSAIKSIGEYIESLKNNYEDIDMSRRIYKKGFKLIYNPDAKVEHLRVDTIKSVLDTYWRWCSYAHINQHNARHTPRRIIARILMIIEICHNFSAQDLLEKRLKLLFLDYLLLFYLPVLDIKYFLERRLDKKGRTEKACF